MVNKRSPFYVKSEFKRNLYGSKNSTTFERSLKVTGRDRENVKYVASETQHRVM
jgi:hypothetical protein